MLTVSGVSHTYDKREVLKNISFEVERGEILVVMGSSGGGKTTLLKCISGLLRPTKGDVTVDGVSIVTDTEKAQSKLGLVFQYAALFDYMNVEDNVIFGVCRKRKMSRAEKSEFAREQLAAVGLIGIEKMMPSELSGGMRKRVGLARAMALEPSVLLYDEPTSGLDPITAYAIDSLIVETRDRSRATSIVVSHDVTSVMRVADRIAFLHQGELLFLGTPDKFREASSGPIKELVEKARTESLISELGR